MNKLQKDASMQISLDFSRDNNSELIFERIRGSLYGLLIGDALGCPVEGWLPERIYQRYGLLATMEEGSGWQARRRGLHSDDGQQAMALCDAILAQPDHPAEGFARQLVELYTQGPKGRGEFGYHRGTGANFRTTVKALANGAALYEASQPSAGNGNAMLIAPAAWYWRDDQATLGTRVIDISLVKQHHPCGIASAAAVAFVICYHLNHGSFTVNQFVDLLAFIHNIETQSYERLASQGLLQNPDHTFSHALKQAFDLFDLGKPDVLDGIANIANQSSERKVGATSGYAVASVITSIYMAITAPSLLDGLLDTINLGGDADTTDAMVGAMLGAKFGFSALPDEWFAELVARDAFDDRVLPLVERRSGWQPQYSVLELEARWHNSRT